jgi:tellurite resistance protein
MSSTIGTVIPTLGINHVQVIVRGMYDVAKADGLHDAELVMLRGFYEDCRREAQALTDFDDLLKIPFDAKEARLILDTELRKAAFLQSCLMLAYADGTYSAKERAKIKELATGIGVAAEALATIETAVADSLMQQLSKVRNVDALREVAAETTPR